MKNPLLFASAAAVAVLAACSRAGAAPIFSEGEKTVNAGVNIQAWAQWGEGQAPDGRHASHDFFIRRGRLYLNGQVLDWLKFNTLLDMDNDGRAAEPNAPVRPQYTEAYLTVARDERAMLSFGLVKIPFSRQNMEGAFSQLLIDKEFIRGKQQIHRGELDFGATLWGSVVSRRLKYYLSYMDGKHGAPNLSDLPRFAARGEIHLLEPDAPASYEPAGTYLGAKKVLTVGGAFDRVPNAFVIGDSTTSYKAWTFDVFLELPWRGGAWTTEAAFLAFDHGAPQGALAPADEGRGFYVQTGWLLPGEFWRGHWLAGRLQPVARLSSFDSRRETPGSDENRWSFGLNHYLKGHDLKLHLDATLRDFRPEDPASRPRRDHWLYTLAVQVKI